MARHRWLMPIILATWEAEIRIVVRGQLSKNQAPIPKIPNTKRAGRVAQVVEHLPSNHEAKIKLQYHKKRKKKKKSEKWRIQLQPH
jgi:hypothetical protein